MSTALSLNELRGIVPGGFKASSLPGISQYGVDGASLAGYAGDSTQLSSEAMAAPLNPGAGTDSLSSFMSAWGMGSGSAFTSPLGSLGGSSLPPALELLYQKNLASAMLRMMTGVLGCLGGTNALNGLNGLNNGLNNNQNNNGVDNGGNAVDNNADNGNVNNNAVNNGNNNAVNNGNNNAKQQGIIDEARTWLGTPYLYGGTTRKGVDCSGFVQNVFKAKGIDLPRVTTDQVKKGREVSKAQLQPGDLVFFHNNGHVGIYIGNGQYIHSPHTGDQVKISSLAGADISACRRVL